MEAAHPVTTTTGGATVVPASGGCCPAGGDAAVCAPDCVFARIFCSGPFSIKSLSAWENPVNSAAALVGTNLVYFFLCCVLRISFVAITAAALTVALGAGFVSKSFTGSIPPFKEVSEEQAKERGAKFVMRLNGHRRMIYDLVHWNNSACSLGFFICSLLSVFLLWRLPLVYFFWIGTNVMLTWRHLSHVYKQHGARYVNKAVAHSLEFVNKIPRGGKHHRS